MSNALPSGNTPVKHNRIQDSVLSAAEPNIKIKRRELRFSMHRKYIVISPAQFFRRYVPPVEKQRNDRFSDILKNVPVAPGRELQMYEPLVDALNGAKICPGFKFAITAARGDPSDPSNEAVDIGLYPSNRVPRASTSPNGKVLSPPTDWSAMELCIECKTNSQNLDPFDDTNAGKEPTTNERKGVLGQILSYAEFILKKQQRTCVYMVLLFGDVCRIARFDRAGVIVTQPFNYKTDGGDLIEFLWRYAQWDVATRGHDPSAERITPSSKLGKKMQARATKDKDTSQPEDYMRKMFEESLDTRWSWWKLRVDDDGHDSRFFLVGKPNFQAPGVAGRGTRGYVAIDADNINGPFYYLKDAWRVVSRHIDKEGKILQSLNRKGVRYIPTLECHGDIKIPAEQWTQTLKLWDQLNKNNPDAVRPFKKHKHYRIVVNEVGQQMSEFNDSQELIYTLWCCIYAHSLAYRAGVIHRDISVGNVLRYYDQKTRRWVGLLTDWELSKNIEILRLEGRQLDRTGTWQFMSASALDDPTKQIVVEDELESFFHVLLYLAIRFLHHNCKHVPEFMHGYFDDHSPIDGGYGCGKFKMLCMVSGQISLKLKGTEAPTERQVVDLLAFSWPPSRPDEVMPQPHPLNGIIDTILEWLKAYYSLMKVSRRNIRSDFTQQQADAPRARGAFVFDDEEDEGRDAPSRLPPPPRKAPLTPEQLQARAEEIAEKIHTHSAILDLLKESLQDDVVWPANDKKDDQLRERGYKHGADLPLPSTDVLKLRAARGHESVGGSSRMCTSEQVEPPATPRHVEPPQGQQRPPQLLPPSRMSTRQMRRKT